MNIIERDLKFPKPEGITPLKLFVATFNVIKFDKLPSDEGKLLANLLPLTTKDRSMPSFPIEEGRLPTKFLPFKIILLTRLNVHTTPVQPVPEHNGIVGEPALQLHPLVSDALELNDEAKSHIAKLSSSIDGENVGD
jgi:hypothetical protein